MSSSSIIYIFQILFLTHFFPFHITSETETCELRFSVLVYIWKFISTYMALTFLFFSKLKNLPKKKNQQQHSIRYFRRVLGIHMIYRLTNLIALQQFLCQSNVWRAPRYFFFNWRAPKYVCDGGRGPIPASPSIQT